MYRPSEPVCFFDFIENDDMGVLAAITLFKNAGELNKLPPRVPGVRHPDMEVGVPKPLPKGELMFWKVSLAPPRGVALLPPKPLSAMLQELASVPDAREYLFRGSLSSPFQPAKALNVDVLSPACSRQKCSREMSHGFFFTRFSGSPKEDTRSSLEEMGEPNQVRPCIHHVIWSMLLLIVQNC